MVTRLPLTKIDVAIVASASIFVVILQVASYLDRSIVALHIVEALPYIVGPLMCLKRMKFGYALTFAAGIFWLWCAGFLSTFIRNGFEQLASLLETGVLERVDIIIAVPAAIGTAGLAIFSLIGYFGLGNRAAKDAWLFLLAMVLITLFFLAIFKMFAPGFLEMFRGVLF